MEIINDSSTSSDDTKADELKMEITNYETRLNQEWVQVLINLRMKYSKFFTRKRNSANDAWKSILDEMYILGAPESVTIGKIKKKWMNLVARYKYLKLMNNAKITWPYYEQIDRAFMRNPNLFEIRKAITRKKSEGDKEAFTTNLINLRKQYSSHFTGKKYAAQNGWIIIKQVLPDGNDYTIEQLSKCWQNLIQRYKSVLENEPNIEKIQWVHFPKLHEILSQRTEDVQDNLDEDVGYQSFLNNAPVIKEEVIENEKDNVIDKDDEIVEVHKEGVQDMIDINNNNKIVVNDSVEAEEVSISMEVETPKASKELFSKETQFSEALDGINPATMDDLIKYMKCKDRIEQERFKCVNSLLRAILKKM